MTSISSHVLGGAPVLLDTYIVQPPAQTFFELLLTSVPANATPILDEETRCCLGYCVESVTGVYKIYDCLGSQVAVEETPLENPPIDPTDIVLLGAGIFRIVGRGVSSAISRGLTREGAVLFSSHFRTSLTAFLGSRFRRVTARDLRFTATTAARMADPKRFVPVQILHLAVRFGKRTVDPQKVKGVFRFEIPMRRLIKRGETYTVEAKTLEVVVRESDWTILHFMYF